MFLRHSHPFVRFFAFLRNQFRSLFFAEFTCVCCWLFFYLTSCLSLRVLVVWFVCFLNFDLFCCQFGIFLFGCLCIYLKLLGVMLLFLPSPIENNFFLFHYLISPIGNRLQLNNSFEKEPLFFCYEFKGQCLVLYF